MLPLYRSKPSSSTPSQPAMSHHRLRRVKWNRCHHQPLKGQQFPASRETNASETKHKQYFLELKELNEMAENIKTIVKSKGLSMDTLQIIELEYNKINYTWVKQIFYDINNRLISEHSKCGIYSKPIFCCSDIIESIFGKFKMKTNQTVGGIYETILSIVLFCSNLTEKLITEILTRVKMSDVENWFEQMAGVSNLAKRRIAFG